VPEFSHLDAEGRAKIAYGGKDDSVLVAIIHSISQACPRRYRLGIILPHPAGAMPLDFQS